MAEMKDVVAKIISQKGTCALGHKVGDEFLDRPDHPIRHVCLGLLRSVALRYGAAGGCFLPLGGRRR